MSWWGSHEVILFHHCPLSGGVVGGWGTIPTCNVRYMFQGGLENVILHFEGIWKPFPNNKWILHFGMVPPEKYFM